MAKLMLERTRGQYRMNCEHTKPKSKMFKFNKSDPDSEAQAKKEAEDDLAELNTKWEERNGQGGWSHSANVATHHR